MPGYVYLIACDDRSAAKIGWAVDPERRRRALQTGNPKRLVLLGFIPGTREDEQALHNRFSSAREVGEWFRLTPEIEQYFMPHWSASRGRGPIAPPSGAPSEADFISAFLPGTKVPPGMEAGRRDPSFTWPGRSVFEDLDLLDHVEVFYTWLPKVDGTFLGLPSCFTVQPYANHVTPEKIAVLRERLAPLGWWCADQSAWSWYLTDKQTSLEPEPEPDLDEEAPPRRRKLRTALIVCKPYLPYWVAFAGSLVEFAWDNAHVLGFSGNHATEIKRDPSLPQTRLSWLLEDILYGPGWESLLPLRTEDELRQWAFSLDDFFREALDTLAGAWLHQCRGTLVGSDRTLGLEE